MPDGAKKGITVKVDAALHAEVSAFIREHGMTMSEFVASALDNELHPKITEKEGNEMGNTRTVAFQVPEELFQRIKDYLNRNHMTQKQFLLGLIERELDREQSVREGENAVFDDENEPDDEESDLEGNGIEDDFEDGFDDEADEDEFDDEESDEEEIGEDSGDEAFDEDEYDDEESEDDDYIDDESEDEGYEMTM